MVSYLKSWLRHSIPYFILYALTALAFYAAVQFERSEAARKVAECSEVCEVESRADDLEGSAVRLQRSISAELVPIRDMLLSRSSSDTATAMVVAGHIVRESREAGLDPRLVAGTILVENPWLKSDTVSHAGAVGFGQVIPEYWIGVFPECGDDLTRARDNVCYTVRILSHLLEREWQKATRRALLAYNGCVSTPGCEKYSDDVLRWSGIEGHEVWRRRAD